MDFYCTPLLAPLLGVQEIPKMAKLARGEYLDPFVKHSDWAHHSAVRPSSVPLWHRFNQGGSKFACPLVPSLNSTEGKLSTANLYLNGKLTGTIEREIKISWDEGNDPASAIMLGLNYIGGLDELTVYNRDLTAEEIEWLDRSNRK